MESLHNARSRQPDLEQTWAALEQGVNQVMTKLEEGISHAKYMQLYTSIYDYCTSSAQSVSPAQPKNTGFVMKGAHIYSNLKDYLHRHLASLLAKTENLEDENLLRYYTEQWERYSIASKFVHRLFAYVNRYWVNRELDESHRNVYDIYTLTLVSWRDVLFSDVHSKVMNAVLGLIENQRNGETVSTGLIKQVVSNFVSLGLDDHDFKKSTLQIYTEHFEVPFIEATENYYRLESEKFISENSVVDYMKKAEVRLSQEENRVDSYLHTSTKTNLVTKCEDVLIRSHMQPMQDEFQSLLDQDKIEDMTRMYGLLCRIPEGLDQLRTIFEAHVKKQGLMNVEKVALATPSEKADGEDEEGGRPSSSKKKKSSSGADAVDPKVYVDSLLEVHKKYADLVNGAFRGEAGFVASLDKACREFVNRNAVCKSGTSKSPEMLAKFCDALLRKNKMVSSEDGETEEVLNSIMTVFKYVEDKDVFQKFYSKMLAKRLVNATSASEDMESSMITKLKDACGYEYTSKLQRMFTDITVSRDLNQAFRDQMEVSHASDALDFDIKVLATGQWPLNPPSTPFSIPDDLVKTYDRFQRFYMNKHQGRKLNWLFQLCKGELKTTYLKASKAGYTFQVSNYQMGILLQYNNATTYSWEELLSNTQLTPEILKGQLGVLIKGKVLVPSKGALADPSSTYDLNMDFKSKKIRINFNVPIKAEQKAESDETHKTIEEDRKILIQAAIVRIMKTRKTLKHLTLMDEVISQLQSRFKPKIPDIKKCIDILLEKEYIERNKDQKDMYTYLA